LVSSPLNRDPTSIAELYPGRRMIARLLLVAHLPVDIGRD
jgi:hypothetical protein